jgi:hypothetical protein
LSAWATSWINAIGLFVTGWLNARESRAFAKLPARPDQKITRQMVQYVLPNLPSYLFFALQGQIALFLISYFGFTRSIAEVGALGRLGQLFLLLSGFNAAVIEPFMARLPDQRVRRSYLFIAATAAAICVPICTVGFLYPNLLLVLLGPKYSSLGREAGWLILSSCIGYLVGVFWTMTAARRWIYWTTTWTTIGVILLTQTLFLSFIRVDNTMNAILFGLATNCAYFVAMLFNSLYGFIHGPRIPITEVPASQDTFQQVANIEQILE